jgi:hypothetical protein
LKLSKLDWFTVLSSRWFQSNTVFMKKEFLNGSVFALWYTRPLELLMTLFSTMFCNIKSEYCLDFINLFGLVLVTQSEGEVAGTRPSTTLNINIRRWAVLLSLANITSLKVHYKRLVHAYTTMPGDF